MAEGLSSAPSTSAPSARQADLTPRDWLEAGQALLKRGGLKALKLRPLAAELNASTGSFYHHFADFSGYEAALAHYFAGPQIESAIADITASGLPPLDRIRALVAFVLRAGMSRLALAMRAWAESEPRARAAVRQHDDVVIRFLTDCLIELGFTDSEAVVRAYALMAIGHANIHMQRVPLDELREGLIRLMCQTPSIAAIAPAPGERTQ
jgi:AcrR family transcriptional regulator